MRAWLCRCLCYPQVIYTIISMASQAGVDALAILRTCSSRYHMQSEWALKPASSGNGCPEIPLTATAGDLALLLGDEPILAGYPMWAWHNILQAGDYMSHPEYRNSNIIPVYVGMKMLQYLLLTFLCVPVVYLLVHHVLLKRIFRVYRLLKPLQMLICCQHGVFVVLLSLQLVPQTVLAMRVLFRHWTAAYVTSDELAVLMGCFLMSHAALYLIEACVRSVHFSWLLICHHLLFFVVIVIGFWKVSVPVFAIGITLDLFVCHEVFLYVVLLGYRLIWPPKPTLRLLWFACCWYLLTRVLQTVMLLYMIIKWASYPAVKHDPAFIVTAVICGLLTVLQLYTVVVYKGIGRKLQARVLAEAAVASVAVAGSGSTVGAQFRNASGKGDASAVIESHQGVEMA